MYHDIYIWSVSNSDEKLGSDFVLTINLEIKKSPLILYKKIRKNLKKINNFEYSNNKLKFKSRIRNAEVFTTIDFNDNSVFEEWVTSDGTGNIAGDCNDNKRLAKL